MPTLTKERTGSNVEGKVERIEEKVVAYPKRCGFQDKICNYACSLWDRQNVCCVFTVIARRLDLK